LKKKFVALSIIFGLTLIAGTATGCGPKTAKSGDKVKVDYVLTLSDGTEVDSSKERGPLEFTIGSNEVIIGFEKAVIGMKIDETKTVSMQPVDGYGEYDNTLKTTFTKSQMPADYVPKVGEYIPVQDGSGQTYSLPILAVNEDGSVVLDLNHPLAGKVLTFEITLVEIVKE
jgi:peptidylprolyl isomerase